MFTRHFAEVWSPQVALCREVISKFKSTNSGVIDRNRQRTLARLWNLIYVSLFCFVLFWFLFFSETTKVEFLPFVGKRDQSAKQVKENSSFVNRLCKDRVLHLFSFVNKLQSRHSPYVQGTLICMPVFRACRDSGVFTFYTWHCVSACENQT